ncbi:MAG: phospho-N-acetylmuramoyl-pentapeptide-transferase [Polyangiaceae bacterium]|nr:phospho-N-acetylmuramoyl-pentapeptide-transferase [Polyangiaceae bacterium]MCW5790679.1 phospho-N-acetylmuramoyl-pentapeptide-transferase [Polyangiaceae bacterium]
MLYELLYPLSTKYSWASSLNVVRYIPFRAIMATLTAMALCFWLAPWFIRELQKKQIGQVIRKDGPESHRVKAGTPTMGGALILLSVLVPTMLWADVKNPFVLATAAVTAGYGLIGFIDDRLKIQGKNTKGLAGRYKLLGQALIGGAALAYVFLHEPSLPAEWLEIRNRLAIPFVAFSKHPVELNLYLYLAFALFVVVAMSNAVNLTDGLDGLAIGPVMINAGTYVVWAYVAGLVFFGRPIAQYLDIAGMQQMGELAVFGCAVIGAGIGFLWYNTYPAQVFMGDVGSLALGGGLGMMAVLTKNELLSVLVGGIFVLEAVSVITQVASFKLFGRRVFLMAPIHHHFEKKGWPEPRIIVRFWIISVLLALVGLASLKLR